MLVWDSREWEEIGLWRRRGLRLGDWICGWELGDGILGGGNGGFGCEFG